MIFEAKISTVPEGIKVTTTGKEDDTYSDILTTAQKIGRHRAWSKLAEWAGFSGYTLGAFATTYAVFQQPFRLSHLALAATASALCMSVAIIGIQEGGKAGARENALKESYQPDFLVTT